MTELKRPKLQYREHGGWDCYDMFEMDSFLSQIADKLEEARRLRKEAEPVKWYREENIASTSLESKRKEQSEGIQELEKADAVEEEAIKLLRGE